MYIIVVLSTSEDEKQGTKIGTYLFVKNYDKIAEAIRMASVGGKIPFDPHIIFMRIF